MFFKSEYAEPWEILRLDAILVVPFGTHRDGEEINPSNRALGEAARRLKEKFPLVPIGIQWEHEDMRPPLSFASPSVGMRGTPRISTREFFLLMKESHPEWIEIGILAHPLHAQRCKWIAEKMGYDAIILDPGRVPYSPKDMHFQVRSSLYILWEILSRVHHKLNGWI